LRVLTGVGPSRRGGRAERNNLISLRPLQDLSAILRDVAAGTSATRLRRRAQRSLDAAGDAALPLLRRGRLDDSQKVALFCGRLLAERGGGRVVRALTALVTDRQVPDRVKALALGLLTELSAPLPVEVPLLDPRAMITQSVRDLTANLRTAGDLARAADLCRAQIGAADLVPFCDELLAHGGPRGRRLVRAIADRLDAVARAGIEALLERRAHARLLDRATRILEGGDAARAEALLRRHAKTHPDDGPGRSALGVCLLGLHKAEAALPHLEAAAVLEPSVALHHWNLAAAAQETGRVGRAYLALRSYLESVDQDTGAYERQAEAAQYLGEYERAVADQHPRIDPADLAAGEERFRSGCAALAAGDRERAKVELSRLLRWLPDYYPAWCNLGVCHALIGETERAVACWRRALALRPDYRLARDWLARIGPTP
jgi:tetratricopeptide (TPR) repeat protein